MNELVEKNITSLSSGVNIGKIPPIHQKRLLTFVNHFILTTVHFLNNFAQTCERKLLSCEQKMQTLEAALCILEAKFNSIPGLDDVQTTIVAAKDETDKPPDIVTTPPTLDELPNDVQTVESESAPPNPSNNPELSRFIKMVHFGVPVPAVKLKMQQEGFDPNLLD